MPMGVLFDIFHQLIEAFPQEGVPIIGVDQLFGYALFVSIVISPFSCSPGGTTMVLLDETDEKWPVPETIWRVLLSPDEVDWATELADKTQNRAMYSSATVVNFEILIIFPTSISGLTIFTASVTM